MDINGKENHYISWSYPEIYDRAKQSFIEIGLCHTRSADSIRIKYDSERDGWVIEQDAFIDHDQYSEPLEDWKEVAFIKAWGRELKQFGKE